MQLPGKAMLGGAVRKVFAFVAISADGYYRDLEQALDWQTQADEEFHQFLLDQLSQADTLVLGRATYQRMVAAWFVQNNQQPVHDLAEAITAMTKIVISQTVNGADMPGTQARPGPVDDELLRLKERPGKGILVLGSSELTAELLRAGLVNELRILVDPVIVGQGRPAFAGGYETGLRLASVAQFKYGKVLLRYNPPIGPRPHMVRYPDGHIEFAGWRK